MVPGALQQQPRENVWKALCAGNPFRAAETSGESRRAKIGAKYTSAEERQTLGAAINSSCILYTCGGGDGGILGAIQFLHKMQIPARPLYPSAAELGLAAVE